MRTPVDSRLRAARRLFGGALALVLLTASASLGAELRLERPDEDSLRVRGLRPDATWPDQALDLKLERFHISDAASRFVVGRDRIPSKFDPQRVRLYRGKVAGYPDSRLFVALGRHRRVGILELGEGLGRVLLSGRDAQGRRLPADRLFAARADSSPGAEPGLPAVPECGLDALPLETRGSATVATPRGFSPTPGGTKQIELAVETDFEFSALFESQEAAAEYVVMLYGAISEIYRRDLDTTLRLTFVRLWDRPDDLFNVVDPTPLFDFRDHWNSQMADVPRDVAQLISGRRDYPFGGQAFVSQLCQANGYSVVGYMLGAFPDPSRPSPYHYDLSVVAHELGHSAGSVHTHDAPNFIDTCNDPTGRPQRGTIMSYCAQTWSGQNANRDLYFHSGVRGAIRAHLEASTCIANDCDGNGVADAEDLQVDRADLDGNGILDRCEDCNGNGRLDGIEIEDGTAPDLDGNGVPDRCQADCNGNEIPDDLDLADGREFDLFGNGILDVCEPDCNDNGRSDYYELQVDMGLDVDRDRILDACQDCDGDGRVDLDALRGAHDLWVASGLDDQPLREFHATSGALVRQSQMRLPGGRDVLAAPNGEIWVSAGDGRVVAFERSGAFSRDVVAAGTLGVSDPTGLAWLRGKLLVADRASDAVQAFSLDGAALGAFVTSGSGGLVDPFGLAVGPRGNLFVTSENGAVLEYDGLSGAFERVFVNPDANAGLEHARGMTFKPDGNLLVASFGSNEVLEFDGFTGRPLGPWARVGTATRLTRISPWGVRVGPNGNVFVSRTGEDFGSSHPPHVDHDSTAGDDTVTGLHLTNAQIYEFDVRNGNFLRTHVGGNDHGLRFTTGFDFVPGWGVDCNRNRLPDTCENPAALAQCAVDCNGNDRPDRLDLIPYGAAFDCNANLVPDGCDIDGGTSADCNANGRPDECESLDLGPLTIDRGNAGEIFDVRWEYQGPGAVYDVAGGDLAELRDAAGADVAGCLANDLPVNGWAGGPTPAAGVGRYFFVRAQTECTAGSYGQDSAGNHRLPPAACP